MHKSGIRLFFVSILLGGIILLVVLIDEPTPSESKPEEVMPEPEPDDFTERMWRKTHGGLPSLSELERNLEGGS